MNVEIESTTRNSSKNPSNSDKSRTADISACSGSPAISLNSSGSTVPDPQFSLQYPPASREYLPAHPA